MKQLRFEYNPISGTLKIHALPGNHISISNLVSSKPYYDGTFILTSMGNTVMFFNISPLAEMKDMEALLKEIQTLLGISDEDVVGKGCSDGIQ